MIRASLVSIPSSTSEAATSISIRPSARLQSEVRAAIISEFELDVAVTPDQLKLTLASVREAGSAGAQQWEKMSQKQRAANTSALKRTSH